MCFELLSLYGWTNEDEEEKEKEKDEPLGYLLSHSFLSFFFW